MPMGPAVALHGRVRQNAVQEGRQEGGELLLPHRGAGSRLDLDQARSGVEMLDRRKVLAVAPSEDVDLDSLLGEPAGHRQDVHVHAAGIAGTRRVLRRRVEADHGHPWLAGLLSSPSSIGHVAPSYGSGVLAIATSGSMGT